jgi:polyhydroxybutyrate depolymerase
MIMCKRWYVILCCFFLGSCGGLSTQSSSSVPGEEGAEPEEVALPVYEIFSFKTAAGIERKWLLRLPKDYSENSCADVIFNFHGSGSSASAQFRYADFTKIADQHSVILVMPDANKVYKDKKHPLASYWNHAWEANLRRRDYDIDFVLELVEHIKSEYCTKDFFATGMASGGDMVSALACLADTPFRSFAPVTYRYYAAKECSNAGPRPTISFQGDRDYIAPIDGSDAPWFDPPMAQVMQSWAEHNGCDHNPSEERVSDEVRRIFWDNCNAETQWYLIEGGGHTWPGGLPLKKLGYTTIDISASDLIWDFFSQSSAVR